MQNTFYILSRIAMWCIAIIIAIAGASKLLDLDSSINDAMQYDAFGVSKTVLAVAVLALSCGELMIGLLWTNTTTRRFGQIAVFLFLCIACAALLYQLQFSNPPNCACFGLLQKYSSLQTDARGALHSIMLLLGIYSTGWLGTAIFRPSLTGDAA